MNDEREVSNPLELLRSTELSEHLQEVTGFSRWTNQDEPALSDRMFPILIKFAGVLASGLCYYRVPAPITAADAAGP